MLVCALASGGARRFYVGHGTRLSEGKTVARCRRWDWGRDKTRENFPLIPDMIMIRPLRSVRSRFTALSQRRHHLFRFPPSTGGDIPATLSLHLHRGVAHGGVRLGAVAPSCGVPGRRHSLLEASPRRVDAVHPAYRIAQCKNTVNNFET